MSHMDCKGADLPRALEDQVGEYREFFDERMCIRGAYEHNNHKTSMAHTIERRSIG